MVSGAVEQLRLLHLRLQIHKVVFSRYHSIICPDVWVILISTSPVLAMHIDPEPNSLLIKIINGVIIFKEGIAHQEPILADVDA